MYGGLIQRAAEVTWLSKVRCAPSIVSGVQSTLCLLGRNCAAEIPISLQLHGYKDEISPAVACLCFSSPSVEGGIAFFPTSQHISERQASTFRAGLAIKQVYSEMHVINEEWGEESVETNLYLLSYYSPERWGQGEGSPTPQRLRGVCNNALPLGLCVFQ